MKATIRQSKVFQLELLLQFLLQLRRKPPVPNETIVHLEAFLESILVSLGFLLEGKFRRVRVLPDVLTRESLVLEEGTSPGRDQEK
jgi:hypothetical protein